MINPNGSFTFTLDNGQTEGSFEYRVIDANNAASNNAAVIIHFEENQNLINSIIS